MDNKYFFDHIHKSGGSSIHHVFNTILGSEKVSPLINFQRLNTALVENKKYQLIQGHFNFISGEKLPVDRLSATVLRDPVDRCLSTYFYYRNDVLSKVGFEGEGINLSKSMSLVEYVNCDSPSVLDHLENFQTRHFYALKWDGNSVLTSDTMLEMSKQALEEYDLVGVTEFLDNFVDVLCYHWSWPILETVQRFKVTSSRSPIQDVKPEVLKKLRALNELDIELYETAKAIYEKTRRGLIKQAFKYRLSHSDSLITDNKVIKDSTNQSDSVITDNYVYANFGNHKVAFIAAEISGNISLGAQLFSSEIVTIKLKLTASEPIDDLTVGFSIVHEDGVLMYGTNSRCLGFALSIDRAGEYLFEYSFQMLLGLGGYWLGASLHRGESHLEECYHWIDRLAFFEVIGKLGKHFEGKVSLQPMINICVNKELGGLIATELSNKSGLNHITFHSPVLAKPSADIQVIITPSAMFCNEVAAIELVITNTGSEHWQTSGQRPVRACYHWLDSNGKMYLYDGLRSALPKDISPGESVCMSVSIKAPEIEGSFILWLTLVQENGVWFDDYGSKIEFSISVDFKI